MALYVIDILTLAITSVTGVRIMSAARLFRGMYRAKLVRTKRQSGTSNTLADEARRLASIRGFYDDEIAQNILFLIVDDF